ncbi:hypothetical protein BpHYR1_031571, partial [Brachionus plicatilis]
MHNLNTDLDSDQNLLLMSNIKKLLDNINNIREKTKMIEGKLKNER